MKKKILAGLFLSLAAGALFMLQPSFRNKLKLMPPSIDTPSANANTELEQSNADAPVYFTIFKFISTYVPFKESGKLQ